ncbi:adenosylcobinamide-phosphate synthase CbiB [Hespellia stercorisuis]|uniref:Cobalamin biosynthesis protein CobD n=1 Tax=Hespellia stercorisuis DSM 15480 TaxID=1121950 RepID=A0A1M6KIV9_9FIRM|nr:adenosylcobinamide-phosphate synthase CbiB [Hespellia stercorisuis]SHJ58877.1 adenosylcobinamide-phosphate synthase [Hespellia stercorisuis DSM 15480]
MRYHIAATFLGFLLDLLMGDPYWMPHPIRLIGNGIAFLEKRMLGPKEGSGRKTGKNEAEYNAEEHAAEERRKGICFVVLVLAGTIILSASCLAIAYAVHPVAGIVVESIMTYQILAMKCLKTESMKVYRELERGSGTGELAGARKAVAMIVGRDTGNLDETGIAKAAIETVAENASDGVIAPMLYTAVGGPVLGFFYKAVNTMDSMVGYKNDRYLHFGRAAAKLDDVVNFIPARISAVLIVLACFLGGSDFDGKHAWQIYKRDRYNHASPNSAQTESACAGALGIQLAGDASYFGKIVKKPYIGEKLRPVEADDIKRVNRLMYIASFLCQICCLLVLGGIDLCIK